MLGIIKDGVDELNLVQISGTTADDEVKDKVEVAIIIVEAPAIFAREAQGCFKGIV